MVKFQCIKELCLIGRILQEEPLQYIPTLIVHCHYSLLLMVLRLLAQTPLSSLG